jgi:hypothetical protein
VSGEDMSRDYFGNMVIQLEWLKKKVNRPNTLIGPDWLNMLIDRDQKKKVTFFKLTKYDFGSPYLDTRYCCFIDGGVNMNNSRGRKRIYTRLA